MTPAIGNQAAHGRPVVLYVEDHPVNALLMEALFERRPGLRLVVANSGLQARGAAQGLNPQLLLLDLHLPDCHGSELLHQLRQVPGCAAAPAVAVTADLAIDITAFGFCERWPKPMNLELVLERLDLLLALRAAPADHPMHRSRSADGPQAAAI